MTAYKKNDNVKKEKQPSNLKLPVSKGEVDIYA